MAHKLVVFMPDIEWSLLQAYQNGSASPPPYVEPTFEEEEFTPRLKLEHRRLPDFERLDHVTRMRRVDEANEVFRFAYTRGEKSGRECGYFKIPLLRDIHTDPNKIKIRISQAEYERATAIHKAIGEAERIVRAVPYHGLYMATLGHLKKMGTTLSDTVLVSVDRGGRIPCIILQRALGLASMQSLKVNQGSNGDDLDEDRLQEFVAKGTLAGKHVLFVDSTVDSGRQINALQRYFDDPHWTSRLDHRSWSIIGSNEEGENKAPNHQDINWGVDPDSTFEDKPELMGIDYAPGSLTKVVECPSETSEAIRRCLLAVPDGWVYWADDIDQQITHQRDEWTKRQEQRRTAHRKTIREERASHRRETQEFRAEQKRLTDEDRLLRCAQRAISSKRWQELVAKHGALPETALPLPISAAPTGTRRLKVLVIGNGTQTMTEAAAEFVADSLAPYCSLLAGTNSGNPGAVLKAALRHAPDVSLYQPEHARRGNGGKIDGLPVIFVGPGKPDMRERMLADADLVLVLGGASGTLHESLLALARQKPLFLIEGYGAVADYVLGNKTLRRKPQITVSRDLPSAVQKVLDRVAA
jgi:hypoxanthine phosphoribosyltransferase